MVYTVTMLRTVTTLMLLAALSESIVASSSLYGQQTHGYGNSRINSNDMQRRKQQHNPSSRYNRNGYRGNRSGKQPVDNRMGGYHINSDGHLMADPLVAQEVSSSDVWERGASLGPTFDETAPRNVTALKDANAYLHCVINNLGNKTLSWIREKDLHILTVGKVTYTADNRFEVIHKDETNSWTLKIHSVQPRDSGRYGCQVNSHPTDPITFEVYLSVFVPTARIVGSTERYVDQGSTINLTCIINHNPGPPSATFWYHNNEVINYDSRGSRVSVITDRGTSTKTILLIHDASAAASGTYSCAPSPSATASVKIHILNAGEMPVAMQTNGSNSPFLHKQDLLLLLLLLLLLSYSLGFSPSIRKEVNPVLFGPVTHIPVIRKENLQICRKGFLGRGNFFNGILMPS